jgi:hypothetical protein
MERQTHQNVFEEYEEDGIAEDVLVGIRATQASRDIEVAKKVESRRFAVHTALGAAVLLLAGATIERLTAPRHHRRWFAHV